MSMKMNLISMVQSILSDMDSESATSITDHNEAEQVALIIRDVFYNSIATRFIPEHEQLLKLTPLSDSEFPTHFRYPEGTKEIKKVWYKDSLGYYTEVEWCEPLSFLNMTDKRSTDVTTTTDKQGGTELRVYNNRHPHFYTSFDDEHLVMDSYEATIDTTLQQSKVRAFGTVYPVFLMEDAYIPDLDPVYFPMLLAEAKSTAMSVLKGVVDPKIEQAARRQKSFIQGNKYNTRRPANWSNYGR